MTTKLFTSVLIGLVLTVLYVPRGFAAEDIPVNAVAQVSASMINFATADGYPGVISRYSDQSGPSVYEGIMFEARITAATMYHTPAINVAGYRQVAFAVVESTTGTTSGTLANATVKTYASTLSQAVALADGTTIFDPYVELTDSNLDDHGVRWFNVNAYRRVRFVYHTTSDARNRYRIYVRLSK